MPFKLDFKQLAEQIDIGDVAKHLGLTVIKDRATCPVCDSERSIQIFAETNSFRCHSAEISGDCISLFAHIKGTGMYPAAKALSELFAHANAPRAETRTTPQKPGEPLPSASKATVGAPKKGHPPFDPEEYAAKLQYSPEIEALGIGQDDAQRLGIGFATTGFHRGSIVIAIRNRDGTIAGFAGIKGEVKLPNKWLQPRVVEFKKRA